MLYRLLDDWFSRFNRNASARQNSYISVAFSVAVLQHVSV